MNNNEKRWVVLLVAVVVIAVVLIVVLVNVNGSKEEIQGGESIPVENEEKYTTELNDGTKINTGEEFNSTKTYGSLEISNIQFTEKEGMTVLLADVTNKGSTTHENEVVEITILGENGEELSTTKPVIGKNRARRDNKNKCDHNSRCK